MLISFDVLLTRYELRSGTPMHFSGRIAFETTVGRNKQPIAFVNLRGIVCAVPAIRNLGSAGTASPTLYSTSKFASDLFRPTKKRNFP